MLRKERQFYIDNRNFMLKKHDNKFVVIRGKRLIASYDTYDNAYAETSKSFPAGTFLIQHCITQHAALS